MINLDDEALFIGAGNRRHCYHHPDNPQLCIKISPPGEARQQNRETCYYRGMARRNCSFKHVSKYHGTVETTRGTGHVYDLVLDHDGTISKSLHDYFAEEKPRKEELIRLIVELKEYYLQEKIMFYDMNATNILCQRNEDDSLHFVTIDGIGEVTVLGILNAFRPYFLHTFNRRWVRVIRRIHKLAPWTADYSF